MQVTVENPGGLQRRLKVQVPGTEVSEKVDARLREIGKTAKLKGFRPGRVPMKVLEQRYGQSVRREVLNQALQSNLAQALRQEDLRPAASPVIEDVTEPKAGQDLEFTASIEVLPVIDTVDVSSLDLEKFEAEVTETDIDAMLETLREQRQTFTEHERSPLEGEQVIIEYVAETKAGRVPAQGKQRVALIQGASGIDKLDAALADLAPGAETTVKVSFPDDYADPLLAGKKGSMELKVLKVRERHLPELNEEFIRSFAIESGDIEDMRREVRANLEREMNGARLTVLRANLGEKLLAAYATLEAPASMIRQEAAALLRRDAQRRGQEPDPARLDVYTPVAERRVKVGLLVSAIAGQNGIRLDSSRVRDAVETIADTYEQSAEVVQLYYSNPEMLQSVQGAVLEEQVLDWVLDHAHTRARPIAFKELIALAARYGRGAA